MIRMTLLSGLGHFVAMIVLLFLSWFQPIRIKPPTLRRVAVEVITRTPAPPPPQKTPPVVLKTPKPKTPEPKKTIVKTKTPSPTKTPTPTKKPSPTPQPTKQKTKTPKPTPTRTPAPPKPSPTRKTPTPTRTPVVTPEQGQPAAFQPSVLSDYDYYLAAALEKIRSNFTVPRHLKAKGITCLMQFTVMRDGRIVNVQLVESTGDAILDGYARRALEQTAQLASFPDPVKTEHVVLTILFDYAAPSN